MQLLVKSEKLMSLHWFEKTRVEAEVEVVEGAEVVGEPDLERQQVEKMAFPLG